MDIESFITELTKGLYSVFDIFVKSLVVPTTKYIRTAFFVSIGFLAFSGLLYLYDKPTVISVYEALTTSIILLIIFLINANTKSVATNFVKSMKNYFVASDIQDDDYIEDVDDTTNNSDISEMDVAGDVDEVGEVEEVEEVTEDK